VTFFTRNVFLYLAEVASLLDQIFRRTAEYRILEQIIYRQHPGNVEYPRYTHPESGGYESSCIGARMALLWCPSKSTYGLIYPDWRLYSA